MLRTLWRTFIVAILCGLAGFAGALRAVEKDLLPPPEAGGDPSPWDSGIGLPDSPLTEPSPASGWRAFWNKHGLHLVTVFAAQEIEYLYEKKVGVSEEPLFLREPPGFDTWIYSQAVSDPEPKTFVAQHKTDVIRAVALGTIIAAGDRTWSGLGDDLIGLWEAWKFNTATTNVVKMVVGRRRPTIDMAVPGEADPLQPGGIRDRKGARLSFYSHATSQAFTALSYADRILARRLEGRPGLRALSFGAFYGLAAYVGYSRLDQGQHYLSDVLVGAAAGTLIGRTFHRINHGWSSGERTARFRIHPPRIVPGGAEVVVSVRLGR